MARIKRIYLDWAAANPLHPKVERTFVRSLKLYGNPSAAHAEGRAAEDALADARSRIARTLGVKAEELVFTSGGTESNALALLGHFRALVQNGTAPSAIHYVTTTIEHASVGKAFVMLADAGMRVTYIPPEKDGMVSVQKILAAITPETKLISLAHVNSEIGTVQRIAELGSGLRKLPNRPWLHVDAAQSPLYLDAGAHTLRADLVTYDAQKLMGPKGVGILYRDYAVSLAPIVGGGTQERSVRPGTENVPAIVAAATAFEEAVLRRAQYAEKLRVVQSFAFSEIANQFPEAVIVGSIKHRIPNNVHVAFRNVDGDYLTVLMDKQGIAVSPRSACLGSGGGSSTVVAEVTGDADLVHGTLRISMGPTTSKKDIVAAFKALKKALPLATKRFTTNT